LLVGDGDGRAEHRCILAGLLCEARVRGNHDQIGQLFPNDRLTQDGQGVEVIHGDAKEALDLGGVQVQGDHTIGAGHFDGIGADAGTDGVGLDRRVGQCCSRP